MALEDLTPFGTAPKFYEGLLGAEETAALQKRAQIQGLLGAGLALAQGMSRGGAPRSALQNILGAAVGGFQSAGGAYQQGLQNFQTQQQIQQAQIQRDQAKLQRDQALALQQDVQKVMQTPEVANNPSLVALLRADPKEGLKWINENMAVTQAYAKTMPQQQQAVAGSPEAQANTVTAPMDERARLFAENRILTGIGTKRAEEKIQSNLKQIESFDKQEEIVRKQQDFTNEARRVAGYLFPNKDFTQPLTANESKVLNDELQRLNIAQRRAGATVIDMGSREMEKEFAKGVVEDTRASYNQAKSSVNTINAVQRLRPILSAGVYEGFQAGIPRSVDQLAAALKVTGKTTEEKLARTAQAMQQLAALELDAAKSLAGQGAITDFERGLIARASGGNLRDFTTVEINALLDSLDKVARSKIQAHQQNYEIMSSDPTGKKYSKYYKIDIPGSTTQTAPANTGGIRKFNPATGRIE
jgi:hypothetical protein